MLIEVSPDEHEIVVKALEAALDFADTYYVFAPEKACCGAKIFYGFGNQEIEENMCAQASILLKKLKSISSS